MATTAGSADAALVAMCNTSVTRYAAASRDKYGKPTYAGTGDTVAVHLRDEDTREFDDSGATQSVNRRVTIWSPTILNVDPQNDVIELPNGDRPRIVSATVHYDEDGAAHHEKIELSYG